MRRLSNKLLMTMILGGALCVSMSVNATVIDAKPENGGTTTEASTDTTIPAEQTTTQENGKTANGWDTSKKSYYKDGVKLKGFQWLEDDLYYFDSKGILYTKKGIQTIKNNTYYVQDDYSLATGVCEVDGEAYYFDTETGIMAKETGVVKLNGNYYNFDEDSVLQSGWYRNKKNKRYYFSKETYAALTGWNYVGKYKFFFKKNGQLVQDDQEAESLLYDPGEPEGQLRHSICKGW